MSWTDKLSLEQISFNCGVTQKLQLHYIILFLGYRDGDTNEVSDDKPKMDEPSGLGKSNGLSIYVHA